MSRVSDGEFLDDDGVRWRSIEGFEGYRVSEDGRVQSCRKVGRKSGLCDEWRDCKLGMNNKGYKTVNLRRNRKSHFRTVHSLVLEAFVCPRPPGCVVRHYPDNDRTNNHLSNLSWATPKQNQADRWEHGTMYCGEMCHASVLTADDVREIRRLLSEGVPQPEIAKRFGVLANTISRIKTGKRWGHLV